MSRVTDKQLAAWKNWIYRHHFADGNGNEPVGTGALQLLDMVKAERDRADQAVDQQIEWMKLTVAADGKLAQIRDQFGNADALAMWLAAHTDQHDYLAFHISKIIKNIVGESS